MYSGEWIYKQVVANYMLHLTEMFTNSKETQMKNLFKNFTILALVLIIVSISRLSNAQPAGTTKLDDDKYFEITEVEIGAWLSYYSWVLENEGYFAAMKVLPDSNALEPEVWKFIRTKAAVYDERLTSSGQPIGFFNKECKNSKKYGRRLSSVPGSCAYISLPITGITYEQAVSYCEWKTKIQGENKVKYRLPTDEEWKKFAINGLSEIEKVKGLRDSVNTKNCNLFNYKIVCNCNKDLTHGITGIAMFEPEKNRAYDVFGNVSEMTSIKGHSKGGNFTIYAKQCHPDSVQYYIKPESWLGFRCIAEKVNSTSSFNSTTSFYESRLTLSENLNEFVDERDGKKYLTVKIGNQTWFAENLKYKPNEGKCWLPENEEKNINRYGYLYSYETAQNVCPTGWSLPGKTDFEVLLEQENIRGLAINLIASGNSNFDALLGGTHMGVNYVPNGYGTSFWTKTDISNKKIWVMSIGIDNPKVNISEIQKKNSFGYPVRCIKK